jgi:hypothetical protein
MSQRVDTSRFPVGIDISYDEPEDILDMAELKDRAWRFMGGWNWTPPIDDIVLAFGLGTIVGLFLVKFAPGGRPEDAERWVVVGDLPEMHFEADEYPTPEQGLRLYCAIAQDWADSVLEGRDLSECYPIPVAPTRGHAEMLLDRVAFIRTELIWRTGQEGETVE